MALCTKWADVSSFSSAVPSIKLFNLDNVRKRGGGLINPANVDMLASYDLAKGMSVPIPNKIHDAPPSYLFLLLSVIIRHAKV